MPAHYGAAYTVIRVRTWLALVMLFLASAFGIVLVAVPATRVTELGPGKTDWITFYDMRFVELRKVLPQGATVGYVTDQPLSPGQDYLLTQYALAPVVVKRGAAGQLVVGNFHDMRNAAEIARAGSLVPVRDFGLGVVLFKGKAD
jgi:hypothetical protein